MNQQKLLNFCVSLVVILSTSLSLAESTELNSIDAARQVARLTDQDSALLFSILSVAESSNGQEVQKVFSVDPESLRITCVRAGQVGSPQHRCEIKLDGTFVGPKTVHRPEPGGGAIFGLLEESADSLFDVLSVQESAAGGMRLKQFMASDQQVRLRCVKFDPQMARQTFCEIQFIPGGLNR